MLSSGMEVFMKKNLTFFSLWSEFPVDVYCPDIIISTFDLYHAIFKSSELYGHVLVLDFFSCVTMEK